MKLVLLVVTSIAYTITAKVGQWVKGANGLGCDDVCAALTPPAACNADMQSTITSSAAIKAAFTEAGYECKSLNDGWYRDYAGSPFSTGRPGDDCYFLTPGGARPGCHGNQFGHHSALCYCQHSAGQWVKGANGWGCDQVCAALNPPAECNADMQSTILSSAAIKAAFAEAGYECVTVNDGWHRSYAGSPFSTGRGGDDCYFVTPGKSSGCIGNAFGHHSALCYCEHSGQDLCNDAETRCNDNNGCTIDSCDESTGDCIYEDKVCDDNDDCTTNSCDESNGECIYEEIECSNGVYCDGEEYCDSGQCMAAVNVDCPTNFVCDDEAKDCVRDCNLFAIDGYLRDCSSEFAGNEYDIAELYGYGEDLQKQVDDIDERTGDLEEGIDTLEEALIAVQDQIGESEEENPDTIYNMLAAQFEYIGSVETALGDAKEELNGKITDINNDISGIKTNIISIEEEIAGMKTNAQGIAERVGTLETKLASLDKLVKAFGPDKEDEDGKVPPGQVDQSVVGVPFISWNDRNILIVGLLIFNMVLLTVLLVYCCMSKKKYKYQPIHYNSETDQEVTALNK